MREIADAQGFVNAQKRDSQDICFLPDGDYPSFIEAFTGKTPEDGDFLDTDGNVIGRHKGQERYTIGQRKGLGVGFGKPMYVLSKDVLNNTVTLCEDEELFTNALDAADFNWIASDDIPASLDITAKIRYNHTAQPAVIHRTGDTTAKIRFKTPQRAITRGQAVVVYDGEYVIGGGRIS